MHYIFRLEKESFLYTTADISLLNKYKEHRIKATKPFNKQLLRYELTQGDSYYWEIRETHPPVVIILYTMKITMVLIGLT